MTDKSKITKIVEDFFQDTDKFLVEVKITPQNKIMVFVDGDNDITISDCADLSKHIETFFDRDKEDFELEVSSAGVGKPLRVFRQYLKNTGRNIVVTTLENKKFYGKLIKVQNDGIEIELFKKNKKNKKTVKEEEKNKFICFKEIREAKIKAVF